MHHKVSRWALVALLTAVSALAVPAVASAHTLFQSWQAPMSGGTHGLTCAEAKYIVGAGTPGSWHGGVNRVGDCLGFASAMPYWAQVTVGWRANDGSLMKSTVQEDYCYCQFMTFHQDAVHQ